MNPNHTEHISCILNESGYIEVNIEVEFSIIHVMLMIYVWLIYFSRNSPIVDYV